MSWLKRKKIILVSLDILTVILSITLAFALYGNGSMSSASINQMLIYQLIAIICIGISHIYNSLYSRSWKFASVGDAILIIRSVTVAMLVTNVVAFLFIKPTIPLLVLFTSWLAILLATGLSRLSIRLYLDGYKRNRAKNNKRALIVGAGQCGVIIAKELKFNQNTTVYAWGFIDDNPDKLHQEILGIKVLGTTANIVDIISKQNIAEVIIAIPSASRKRISELIGECSKTNVNIQIIPNLSDLIEGKVSLRSMRNVDVEDLLGREPVRLEDEGIESYVKNKVVLITGAGGSIGSELCRQIIKYKPKTLILLGHGENSIYLIHQELSQEYEHLIPVIADVQDREAINQVFETYQPQVVFHAAAHKHVPLMEQNPSEAIKNNVFGTKNVADCADKYKVERFVLISTDKAVNPTSIMGASKRIAEMYIQSLAQASETSYCAVRFGNVLGSRGSVIPLFRKQIAQGGPVTVTHPDMIRYFMTIPEASRLVIQAGGYAQEGEIFVLDMGEPVKIYDLAKQLIRLSGFEPDVDIGIEFNGIRPGEKLYEELLLDDENSNKTHHERIFVGHPSFITQLEMVEYMEKLAGVLNKDRDAVKACIKSIVPTFIDEKQGKPVVASR